MSNLVLSGVVLAFTGVPRGAGEEGVAVTVYNASHEQEGGDEAEWPWERRRKLPAGFAVVKEVRRIALDAGRNTFRFTDVAREIDPTTVHFRSLTDPEGTFIVEQSYEYDLISAEKLLEKYIDRPVTIVRQRPGIEGGYDYEPATLLSARWGNFVVRRADPTNPIEIFSGSPRMRLEELPEGLITRPTLVWRIDARKKGAHLCEVAYETGGIAWRADYTAVARAGDGKIDLSGWVTVENSCGATFENARLKVVAGDVHTGEEPGREHGGGKLVVMQRSRAERRAFEEKAFFEYRLYTLPRPCTLKDNSKKQLELFGPVSDIPARKVFVYFGVEELPSFYGSPRTDRQLGTECNKKVDVYLGFRNSKECGLGIPLPKGRMRVCKEDPADKSLEFIGADGIDHTPKDEEVMLKLGSAFDVVGERKQADFKVDTDRKRMDESFEIKLRNHKEEDVTVTVKEVLYRWADWKIRRASHDYRKIDSRTIHFDVKVPKDGEVTVTYTVHYTW